MRHKIKGDITSWNTSIWEFGQLMKSVSEDEEIILEISSLGRRLIHRNRYLQYTPRS